MKIKRLHLKEMTEERKVGRESRLRTSMRRAEASRESR